jgi:hypothetical protein
LYNQAKLGQQLAFGLSERLGLENMEVQYLNTDLEIESNHDVSKIVEEFGEDVTVLHQGEIRGYQHASFEIAGSMNGANEVINHFCSLVEGLPKEVRMVWDECCSRIMDIGYESGTSPRSFRSEIRASTIQRVAEIGASIVITIYPLSAEPEKLAFGNPTSDSK